MTAFDTARLEVARLLLRLRTRGLMTAAQHAAALARVRIPSDVHGLRLNMPADGRHEATTAPLLGLDPTPPRGGVA